MPSGGATVLPKRLANHPHKITRDWYADSFREIIIGVLLRPDRKIKRSPWESLPQSPFVDGGWAASAGSLRCALRSQGSWITSPPLIVNSPETIEWSIASESPRTDPSASAIVFF